jgi:ankyrin repeat protein
MMSRNPRLHRAPIGYGKDGPLTWVDLRVAWEPPGSARLDITKWMMENGLDLQQGGDRGLFGETALHWAALLGSDRLAERLIENVNPDLKDQNYKSSSLEWAVHGWCDPPAGNHGRQLEVVRLLVAAGATVEPEWMESEKIASSPAMLEVLNAADNYTSVRMVD